MISVKDLETAKDLLDRHRTNDQVLRELEHVEDTTVTFRGSFDNKSVKVTGFPAELLRDWLEEQLKIIERKLRAIGVDTNDIERPDDRQGQLNIEAPADATD